MKTVSIKFWPNTMSDKEAMRLYEKYDFINFGLFIDKKIIKLDYLQKVIESGEKIIIGDKENNQFIKCKLIYNDPWDGTIPVVINSRHKRFKYGLRFDYGFMSVALREGYSIWYNC